MTQKEFLDIINPIKDKLYRFSKRIVGISEEAEDIVQEVIIKLWETREKMHTYKNIEAFAVTVTKNRSLDRLRSKQFQNVSLTYESMNNADTSLQKKIETNNDIENIQLIIEGLPEKQKLVFHLRDVEGYDFEEIEEMLEMNPNAVRTNLSRARKTIRDTLREYHYYGLEKN